MVKNNLTYKDSGVDISAGNKLVDDIKPVVADTFRSGVMSNIGGFAGFFDIAKTGYKDPLLVSATDGVGTKLKIAIDSNKLNFIGQDLVAMCVNDLVVQGAEPLFFLDYFACGKLDNEQAFTVISSIARACKEVNCALIGGETAEMPGMYNKNDFDLAGFAVGAVERDNILPQKDTIKKGDILIGIASSGIHANGFSLVRKIMSKLEISYDDKAEFSDEQYVDIFLKPTKLYVKPCLDLYRNNLAKAFIHITGGGFLENIPRILPENLGFNISYNQLDLSPLYLWLQESAAIEDNEMMRVFNCGYGMVVVASHNNYSQIERLLGDCNFPCKIIGEII
jgi:phosphoribosylformylglycinamidine cyclo-ligase